MNINRPLADLEGGYGGCNPPPPFKFIYIKESNKTKQKIEDNPLENEEERKSCMFYLVFMCACVYKCIDKHFFFSKNFWIRACRLLNLIVCLHNIVNEK